MKSLNPPIKLGPRTSDFGLLFVPVEVVREGESEAVDNSLFYFIIKGIIEM